MAQDETETKNDAVAQGETETKKDAVRREILRMLRERVEDPTIGFEHPASEYGEPPYIAYQQLLAAKYIAEGGHITLAGTDYYRKETANRFLTWWGNNWFGAIVAFGTIVSTMVLTCSAD